MDNENKNGLMKMSSENGKIFERMNEDEIILNENFNMTMEIFKIYCGEEGIQSGGGPSFWAQSMTPYFISKWRASNREREKRLKEGEILGLQEDAARFRRYYYKPAKDRGTYILGRKFTALAKEKEPFFESCVKKLIPYGSQLSTFDIRSYYKEYIRGKHSDWISGVCLNNKLTCDYIFDVKDEDFLNDLLDTNKIVRAAIDVKSGNSIFPWNTWDPKTDDQKNNLYVLTGLVRDLAVKRVVSRWEEYRPILLAEGCESAETLGWFVKKIMTTKITYYAEKYSVKDFVRDAVYLADMGLSEILLAFDIVKSYFINVVDFYNNESYNIFRMDPELDMASKTKIYKGGW